MYQLNWKSHNKIVEIATEISIERERQDKKFGIQKHSPSEWLMILGEEVGEVNKAALEAKFQGKSLKEYREELIQVASVCFAMIECLDNESNNEFAANRTL
jgi:NTP pyrophosphatase (non-canonical NTP hydrolase)